MKLSLQVIYDGKKTRIPALKMTQRRGKVACFESQRPGAVSYIIEMKFLG